MLNGYHQTKVLETRDTSIILIMNEQVDEVIVYRSLLRHCHELLVCVYQNARQYQAPLLLLKDNFGMS